MRTTLDLPEDLMQKAMAVAQILNIDLNTLRDR